MSIANKRLSIFALIFDRFFPFALVGLVGTASQYAVIWVGVEAFGLQASASSGAGYLIGSLINYMLNHRFTFGRNRSGSSHVKSIPRYYISVGAGWVINTGIMGLFADRLGYNIWAVQILATGICFLSNYLAARFWIFGDRKWNLSSQLSYQHTMKKK